MIPLDKNQARRLGQINRASLSPEKRRIYSKRILSKLKKELAGKKRIGIYISMGQEVETTSFLRESDFSFFLPKVVGNTLEFYAYQPNYLVVSSFGVLEPSCGQAVKLSSLEAMVVPLSAFDSKGNRCGYGKGYYDSILQEVPIKIGLAFSNQEVESIEVEEWDVPLDQVITEKEQ